MRIKISHTPKSKTPMIGDRKVIDGVEHVREFQRTASGALNVTGGRYHYVWTPVNSSEEGAERG